MQTSVTTTRAVPVYVAYLHWLSIEWNLIGLGGSAACNSDQKWTQNSAKVCQGYRGPQPLYEA